MTLPLVEVPIADSLITDLLNPLITDYSSSAGRLSCMQPELTRE
jgi:hypothetical protein